MTRTCALVLLVALVVGSVGCGGDDDLASSRGVETYCASIDDAQSGWTDELRQRFIDAPAPSTLDDDTAVLVDGLQARLDGGDLPDPDAFAASLQAAVDHCVGEGLLTVSRGANVSNAAVKG